MIKEINKKRIIEILAGDLPGSAAHSKMAPQENPEFSNSEKCRDAAVMLLIYKDIDSFRIVFIKRNEYDGPHSGQISFPGGMKEVADIDFRNTALRETEEEIGVPASKIEILGSLSPFHIPVSNICVHPYVGWIDYIPEFSPDESEVQFLICPTLEALLDPKNKKKGYFRRGEAKIRTSYIDIEGEMLWGATSMILHEFISLIGY